jgi:hypothetical protein
MGHVQRRLIKHEVIPKCGSFEVRFPAGRQSKYFYWDDLPSRRLRPDLVDGETALVFCSSRARTVGPLRKVTRHWRRASLGRKCSDIRPSPALWLYRNSHRHRKAAIKPQ